jgi:hypothetical protein
MSIFNDEPNRGELINGSLLFELLLSGPKCRKTFNEHKATAAQNGEVRAASDLAGSDTVRIKLIASGGKVFV